MKKKVVIKFRKEEATEEKEGMENNGEENRKSQLKSRVLTLLNQISSERQRNEKVKDPSTEEAEMNMMMDSEFRSGGSGEWHKMDERVLEVFFFIICSWNIFFICLFFVFFCIGY
jgi:hypothetical protein